jgi:hypothetical protein
MPLLKEWWKSKQGVRNERARRLAIVDAIPPTPVTERTSEGDCTWCCETEFHSKACPLGERYKAIQKLGGIPCEPEAK